MKYLLNAVETYRVDNEEEANALIEKAKNSGVLNILVFIKSANKKEKEQIPGIELRSPRYLLMKKSLRECLNPSM